MKKLIALSMAAVMALSLVACGGNNETTTTQTPSSSTSTPETSTPETSTPVVPELALSEKVLAAFQEAVKQNTGADVDDIAEIVKNELFGEEEATSNSYLDATYMQGFDADFAETEEHPAAVEFKKAATIKRTTFGVFIAHIFELNDGTDTEAFIATVKEHADSNWFYGFGADQIICQAEGNMVLLVMCAENVEAPDNNQTLINYFNECLNNNPNATSEDIATYIAEKCYENNFPQSIDGVSPVENDSYLPGFSQNVSGFAEGCYFGPMMGSVPFAGYVFALDKGTDAESFIIGLKEIANLRWNVCVGADVFVTATVSGENCTYVLFGLCPSNENYYVI